MRHEGPRYALSSSENEKTRCPREHPVYPNHSANTARNTAYTAFCLTFMPTESYESSMPLFVVLKA